MGASKIAGMSKGKKYKNSQKKARPAMCSMYTPEYMGRNKEFKTQDGKTYHFDSNGSLRRGAPQ